MSTKNLLAVGFRLSGDWGHFKKPFATSSPLTYYVPPPTALYGLVGAIMGWQRNRHSRQSNQYLELSKQYQLAFSIIPIHLQKYSMGMLWLSTKDSDSDYLRCGIIGRIDKSGNVLTKGARLLMSVEVLRNPEYNILVTGHRSFLEEFAAALQRRRVYYTPYLGISEFIAHVEFNAWHEFELVSRLDNLKEIKVEGVIPASMIRGLPTGSTTVFVERMPILMTPDREVKRFEDIVIPHSSKPLTILIDHEGFKRCQDVALIVRSSDNNKSTSNSIYKVFVGFIPSTVMNSL